MASSINLFFSPVISPQRRLIRTAATATKTSGAGAGAEKSILDFILGGLTKEDQFFETDPLLKKVEKGGAGTASAGRKSSVEPPPAKKDRGFGLGLFDKK